MGNRDIRRYNKWWSHHLHKLFHASSLCRIRSDHSKKKTSFADELVLLSHIISTLFWTRNNCVCRMGNTFAQMPHSCQKMDENNVCLFYVSKSVNSSLLMPFLWEGMQCVMPLLIEICQEFHWCGVNPTMGQVLTKCLD